MLMELNNTAFADSIVAEINNIIEELHQQDAAFVEAKSKLLTRTLELNDIEDRILVEVAFDVSLSNERQREAASASLKRKDDNWVSLTTKVIPELKDQIARLDTERGFKQRKYNTLIAYLRAIASKNS